MSAIANPAEKPGHVAGNAVFISRVHALANKVATAVKGEAYEKKVDDTPTFKASKRASLASRVLTGEVTAIRAVAYGVAAAPGVTTGAAYTAFTDTDNVQVCVDAITDADIEFTISSLWDDLAGVDGWDSLDAV